MATYTYTGTANNDTISFNNLTGGNKPGSGNIFNVDGALGTDTFYFASGTTSYLSSFPSTRFTINPVDPLTNTIVVTGTSSGGSTFTFNFKSVETLRFADKTVTLSYVASNAPVFSSGTTGSVAENAPITTTIYTAVAVDPQGTAVTYSLSGTDAALLNINATSGVVTLKSSANYEVKTSYSFTVTASDGTNTTNQAVVVSVTNLNDNAPVFTSGGSGSVAENAAITTAIYTATATDADNLAALTYSLSGTDASLLNINASTGVVTLKSSADYETKTSYSFTVTASDGANTTNQAVVVSVTNLNDNAPVFTSGATGTVVNNDPAGTTAYIATATDADNLLALSYSLSGTDAASFNINTTTGAVTLKSAASYAAKPSYSFNVVASDGANTTTKAVTVAVQPTNNFAPVFSSGTTGSVAENAPITTTIYTATATDADSNPITYSLAGTDASLLNINATTGVVTLKSSANYETKTSYSFSVIASDGLVAHNTTQNVVVSVTNVNDNAPVFTSGATGSVNENAVITTPIYTATATDADNLGALSYSLSGTEASLLNINSSTGVVTLKASANYEAKTSYSFTVTASDGANTTNQAVVASVVNLNDNAPVFTSGTTGSVAENAVITTAIYTATATDADNMGALSYSLSGTDASLLNIDAVTGVVTLKAPANYEAKTSYSFSVIASDGDATHNATQNVVVSVSNVNDNAPVFTSGATGSVNENAVITTPIYTATATDADNMGALSYSLSGTDASLLNIDAATGVVTLKAPANYEAKTSYSFSVIASDGDATHNATRNVVVSVSNVNDIAPVFTSGTTGTVVENAAASTTIYTATATDADNMGALSYSLSGTDASLLNIDAVTGLVTLKAPANYEAKTSYSFGVVASDGDATHNVTQNVVVSVSNVNEAPTNITLSANAIAENVVVGTGVEIGTLTVIDPDATGNNNVLSLEGTDAASFSISGGKLFFTGTSPDYETKTSYSVTVRSTDGTLTYAKGLTVNVTNLNDNAPVFTSGGTGAVAENTVTSTPIYTAAATDADNMGALSYSLSGTDASLLNIDASTGVVTLKSSADYETKTSYSFNVIASDGDATHNQSKAVVVSVTNLNEVPTNITLSGTTIDENVAVVTPGVEIGTLTITDPDASGNNNVLSLEGADAASFSISGGKLYFTGASPDFETKSSYAVTVKSTDGALVYSKAFTVNVNDLNDPPTSTNDSITMTVPASLPDPVLGNAEKVLALTDFGLYNDQDGNSLNHVKITALPSAGSLQYSTNGITWSPVTLNQSITPAEISAGHLKYLPTAGMSSATIGFLVNDGTAYSASGYTLTVFAEQTQTLNTGSNTVGTSTVTVPTGVTAESVTIGTAATTTIQQLTAFVDSSSTIDADLAAVHDVINSYTGATNVQVQQITLTPTGSLGDAISITGSGTGQEALVIDASALPAGTVLNLNGVEFAVIIGPGHYGGGTGNNIIVADGSSQYIVLGPEDDVIHAGAGDDIVGSAGGDDMLYGEADNDLVFGGIGNDSLYGGTEDDILIGGTVINASQDASRVYHYTITDDAGNDTINGGDGTDIVEFFGDFSKYSISCNTSSDVNVYTVVDTSTGGGTDTVTEVETFKFADQTFNANQATVTDHTAPTITSFTPASGSTNVAVADNIVVQFDENVILGTGTIIIHEVSPTGTDVTYHTEVSNTSVLKVSGNTLIINPAADLHNGASYDVTFSIGSIQDFAGNGLGTEQTFHFSTVAAAASASGGSGGGAGVALAGAAAVGLIVWLVL